MKKKWFYILVLPFLLVAFQNCSQGSFSVSSPPTVDSSSQASGADPLLPYAWHLENTGQKVFSKTAGIAGVDLNLKNSWASGLTGKGIKVRVSDDGVESSHPDLEKNYPKNKMSRDYYKKDWAVDTLSLNDPDHHGTCVAGLIGAIKDNGIGSAGVAPGVTLSATNLMAEPEWGSVPYITDQPQGEVDLVNMSWGYEQNSYAAMESSFEDQLELGTRTGRGGLGKIYVKSSGNSRATYINNLSSYRLGFSVFDDYNNSPYTIVVGAYLANGKNAMYSSPGSNLWISSSGGEDGVNSPAMVTTDRVGCTLGYAFSLVTGTVASIGGQFEKGMNGNSNCNFTIQFNGTSSAAPTLTGSVALLLESKPTLSWRDVKYILAKTAVPGTLDFNPATNYLYQANSTTFSNHASPSGYVWDTAREVNAAGFYFDNYFGFGRVNVDEAVALAKTYQSVFTKPLESISVALSGLNLSIPDMSSTGVSVDVNITENMTIEGIQVSPTIAGGNLGEIAIELISPRGLRSVVVPMNNALDGAKNISGLRFLTNKFYQENSVGHWIVKVFDGRTGNSDVQLTNLELTIWGQKN